MQQRTGARAGRSHSRELQTGDSHRETAQSIHTLPRHKAPREEEPRTGVLLGATDRGISLLLKKKEDTTRRETTQDQPLRGTPRPEEEGSIITTETTLKLTAAH